MAERTAQHVTDPDRGLVAVVKVPRGGDEGIPGAIGVTAPLRELTR